MRTEVDDLLAQRASCGLEPGDRNRLEALLSRAPQLEHDGFDRAAAALSLALEPSYSELPRPLEQRLITSSPELL